MTQQEAATGKLELGSESPHASFETSPIGEYLRRQRMLRGVTTEELARLTRIPIRSLERLEAGQFDGETDGFVRGFVRTVADALGLDAEDAICRMLEEPVPASGPSDRSGGRSLRGGLIGLGVVLLLALTFLGLRAVWDAVGSVGLEDPSREVAIWRDPVRTLAEATGARPARFARFASGPATEDPLGAETGD
ncbi:MAG TPA: helix-turn-helix transcriptional regulator [Myxococcota bacterium]|nr:helix-turn-helix transcriptional regulator [Myxococcota bacterium]